jgi:hypothetical protein
MCFGYLYFVIVVVKAPLGFLSALELWKLCLSFKESLKRYLAILNGLLCDIVAAIFIRFLPFGKFLSLLYLRNILLGFLIMVFLLFQSPIVCPPGNMGRLLHHGTLLIVRLKPNPEPPNHFLSAP